MCNSSLASKNLTDFNWYTQKSVDDATLQNIIYQYGSVVVGYDGKRLQSYTGGVINTEPCKYYNHAVNVVGYVNSGPDAPYYIIRNSWGPKWGEVSTESFLFNLRDLILILLILFYFQEWLFQSLNEQLLLNQVKYLVR